MVPSRPKPLHFVRTHCRRYLLRRDLHQHTTSSHSRSRLLPHSLSLTRAHRFVESFAMEHMCSRITRRRPPSLHPISQHQDVQSLFLCSLSQFMLMLSRAPDSQTPASAKRVPPNFPSTETRMGRVPQQYSTRAWLSCLSCPPRLCALFRAHPTHTEPHLTSFYVVLSDRVSEMA